MTRISLVLFVATVLLVPTARAQDVLRPERVTDRSQFYSRPPGTVAFLPQVRESGDARFAGQWDVLVESGRYEVIRSDAYCFVVNHRDRVQAGMASYVAIGALSILRPGTQSARPTSIFRNQGWSRRNDPLSPRDSDFLEHVALTPEMFAEAHDQDQLEENDRLLTHQWHGNHGRGESWEDRDIWAGWASEPIGNLAGTQAQPDSRLDGKLLRFDFTQSRNSNRPVAFCLAGDRRIATILMVFSPHFSQAERRFELMFRPNP